MKYNELIEIEGFKNPIEIILDVSSWQSFLIIIPKLNIYSSFCHTKTEAIDEVKHEVIELYEKLISIEDRLLGKFPLEWKRYLIKCKGE